jgi:hypothetical protein
MNLMGTGWGGMELIHLVQDGNQWKTLGNTAMNLQVP